MNRAAPLDWLLQGPAFVRFRTLTRFPAALEDKRLHQVIELLSQGADDNGRITARSVWAKWKGWEFCQKKEPSYWLTFLYQRALQRME